MSKRILYIYIVREILYVKYAVRTSVCNFLFHITLPSDFGSTPLFIFNSFRSSLSNHSRKINFLSSTSSALNQSHTNVKPFSFATPNESKSLLSKYPVVREPASKALTTAFRSPMLAAI